MYDFVLGLVGYYSGFYIDDVWLQLVNISDVIGLVSNDIVYGYIIFCMSGFLYMQDGVFIIQD